MVGGRTYWMPFFIYLFSFQILIVLRVFRIGKITVTRGHTAISLES